MCRVREHSPAARQSPLPTSQRLPCSGSTICFSTRSISALSTRNSVLAKRVNFSNILFTGSRTPTTALPLPSLAKAPTRVLCHGWTLSPSVARRCWCSCRATDSFLTKGFRRFLGSGSRVCTAAVAAVTLCPPKFVWSPSNTWGLRMELYMDRGLYV